MSVVRWEKLLLLGLSLAPTVASAHDIFAARSRVAASCRGWQKSDFANYRDARVVASTQFTALPLPELANSNLRVFSAKPEREQLQTSGVSLSRVGVTLFDTGHYLCTGQLSFDGGPDARFQGANVRIRLRGYSETPQHVGTLNGARLVFEFARPIWVPRDETVAVSLSHRPQRLVRGTGTQSVFFKENVVADPVAEVIKREFPRITHVEVVLDYLHRP